MRVRKGRPIAPLNGQEQEVFGILTQFGKSWLTKSGPGARRNFIEAWAGLNEGGRAIARRKGWARPSWTGAARQETRKLKRRTKRNERRTANAGS